MLEAYIGAIFVDSNFSFEVVEDFFQRYLKQYFEDMSIYDAFANKHPTVCIHSHRTTSFTVHICTYKRLCSVRYDMYVL